MNIEEIMKPYYDKLQEFSKRHEDFEKEQDNIINQYEEQNRVYKSENDSYESDRKALQVRLSTLRENKKDQIEEYVKNAVSDRPDFYAGYGAMIRKDLEQEYLNKEKALELEIIDLTNKMNENYLKMSNINKLIRFTNEVKEAGMSNQFHRVDIRELVDIKHDLRRILISTKKDLEIKLQETNLKFDAVMFKLSTFKHEYDENHNVLNGSDYRKLFEESNSFIEIQHNLETQLKKIDEYLKVTELTEEEIKTIMVSMTPVEKEEYDRRKAIVETSEEVVIVSEDANVEPLESKSDADSIVYEVAKESIQKQQNEDETYAEFIKEISKDVMESVKGLRTIRIEDGKYVTAKNPGYDTEFYEIEGNSDEEIEVVNGLYLNENDVSKALDNYRRKNKGRTFTVKGIDKDLTVTKGSVEKVKEALKKCCAQNLLSEKKLSSFDIKRVFGKKNKSSESENLETRMPTGNYILKSDVYKAFKDLFTEKAPSWLERLASKFKFNEYDDEFVQDVEYENVEDEMTWNADEPEYEVVRAKTK